MFCPGCSPTPAWSSSVSSGGSCSIQLPSVLFPEPRPWDLPFSCRLELNWGNSEGGDLASHLPPSWTLSPSCLPPYSPLGLTLSQVLGRQGNPGFPLKRLDYGRQCLEEKQELHRDPHPADFPSCNFPGKFCLTFGHLSGIWRAGQQCWNLSGLLVSVG